MEDGGDTEPFWTAAQLRMSTWLYREKFSSLHEQPESGLDVSAAISFIIVYPTNQGRLAVFDENIDITPLPWKHLISEMDLISDEDFN